MSDNVVKIMDFENSKKNYVKDFSWSVLRQRAIQASYAVLRQLLLVSESLSIIPPLNMCNECTFQNFYFERYKVRGRFEKLP